MEYNEESRSVRELPTAEVHQLSILNCYGSFGTPDQVMVRMNATLHHSVPEPQPQTEQQTQPSLGPALGMRLPVRRPPLPAQSSPRSEAALSDDSGILSENRDDISTSPLAKLTPPSITPAHQRRPSVAHIIVPNTPQAGADDFPDAPLDLSQPRVRGPSQTIEIVPEIETNEPGSRDTPSFSGEELMIKTENDADAEAEHSQVTPAAVLGTVSVVANDQRTLGVADTQVVTMGTLLTDVPATITDVVIKDEPIDMEIDAADVIIEPLVTSRKGKALAKGSKRGQFKSSHQKKCRGVKVMTSFPSKQRSVTQKVTEEEKRRKLTVFVEDFLKIRLNAISRSETRKKRTKTAAVLEVKSKSKSKPQSNTPAINLNPKKAAPKKGQARKASAKSKKEKTSMKVTPEKVKHSAKKRSASSEAEAPIAPLVVQAIKDQSGGNVEYHVKRRKFKLPADKALDKITMNLPGNTKDFIEDYETVKHSTASDKPQLDEHTKQIVDAVLHNPKNERFKRSLSNFKKGIFLCQICNKRCRNRKAYVRHQKEHAGVIDVYLPYITKGIGPVDKLKSKRNRISIEDVSSGESEDEENYECKVCGKVLQSKRTYRHHKTIHQRIDPSDLPRCRLCGTFFTKITSLHHHLRTAHYVCWQCGDRRKSSKDLNHHRKMAHSALCEICGISCVSPKALTQHAAYHFLLAGPKEFKSKYQIRKEKCQVETPEKEPQPSVSTSAEKDSGDSQDGCLSDVTIKSDMKSETDPNDPRPYLCQCGRRLKTWDSFQAHSMIHRGLKPYSCPVCKKGFLSSSSRKTHVRHVHSDDRPYQCEYCEEKFKSSSSRDVHTRLHHTKEKPHKCDECGMEFSLTSSLKSHKQAKHSVKPDYVCKVCNREFKLPGTLAIHMRQHTGEKPYVCNQCGKAFRQGSHLRTHVRTHSDERLYPCQICNKSFTQSSHLNTHMKIHQDSKEHKCKFCGKGFNLANTLKTHLRIHTGEKPFKCSICDRTFNQSSARNSHEKCHSDEKPLECEICGARFKLKGTLKTHMLVHSKELPYKCTKCEKAFTTSSSLKLHINTKHEKNLKFSCEHCDKKFVAKHLLDRHEVTHFDASCTCSECGKVMKNKFTLKSHMKKYHNDS